MLLNKWTCQWLSKKPMTTQHSSRSHHHSLSKWYKRCAGPSRPMTSEDTLIARQWVDSQSSLMTILRISTTSSSELKKIMMSKSKLSQGSSGNQLPSSGPSVSTVSKWVLVLPKRTLTLTKTQSSRTRKRTTGSSTFLMAKPSLALWLKMVDPPSSTWSPKTMFVKVMWWAASSMSR